VAGEGAQAASTVELAVRDHPGARPAVVALHGLASNARWWDLVAARLPNRLVAPDLRGHGESPKPVSGYSFREVAADVLAVLDRLGLERVAVVGHSWGASVALTLGAENPDRILSCVLVDGGIGDLRSRFAGGWPEAEIAMRPPDLVGVRREVVERWARGPLAEGSDVATAAHILLGNFEPIDGDRVRPRLRLEGHMQIARALFELDGVALLERVGVPVVAILADGPDSAWMDAKRDGAERARRALGERLRVTWIAGGHDLPVQRPDEVAREITATLAAATSG
jgi:lipase